VSRVHKTLLAVWLSLILLLLPGCYDATEIDNEIYALAIGVDKGVNNMLQITFQYATYKDNGGGGGQGQGGGGGGGEENGEVDGTIVATVEAPSLLEAINMINASSNRQMSLTHAKMLVFSEEYAREGIGGFIETITRFREIRETMRIVVCNGSAQELIRENKSPIGPNTAKNMELFFYQAKNSGYFPDIKFHDFYNMLLSPFKQPTAIYAGINNFQHLEDPAGSKSRLDTELDVAPGEIPRTGGNKKEYFGTAVFNGDKMVGFLTPNETRFYLIASGQYRWGYFTLPDENSPGESYVLEVAADEKPAVKIRFEDGVPVIDLKVSLTADIASIESGINYEKLDKIHGLEQSAAAYLKKGINDTIRRTQIEWNSDIFEFGKKVAGKFRTIQEMEAYNWLTRYKEARVNVDVDLELRKTGFLFETRSLKYADQS